MAMLTLPLEFATEMLNTVLSEDSKAWQGRDNKNTWTVARGKDDDTGLDIFIVMNEPLIYSATAKE